MVLNEWWAEFWVIMAVFVIFIEVGAVFVHSSSSWPIVSVRKGQVQ
jgi:hypothetical protein